MTSQASEKVVWEVSLWGKPRAFTYHIERLSQLVHRKTRGQFEIRLNYGGLSKPRENLEGLASGAFQMAQFCAGYHPEKNRAITVLELPFLGVQTLPQERTVSEAIYAHPAVKAEMDGWNVTLLMPTPLPQYNLVGRGQTPTDVAWFEGKRIRATGGIGRILAEFGAEPVSLTATETREAFATGEIDAVAFAPHAHFAFDTISLAEWWTSNLNPGTVNCPVVVNTAALEALDPKNRKALERSIRPAMNNYIDNYQDLLGKWSTVLEVFDKTVVELPDEMTTALNSGAPEQVQAAWLAEAGTAGLPGQDLLQAVRTTLGSDQ